MDPAQVADHTSRESPDPASHAVNIYDAEGEWLDEEDDDDMDFEPAEDGSEDNEFFDSSEAELYGIIGI